MKTLGNLYIGFSQPFCTYKQMTHLQQKETLLPSPKCSKLKVWHSVIKSVAVQRKRKDN